MTSPLLIGELLDNTVGEGPELPAPQSGPNPQHLLLTLLGDYWFARTEHLPSAAIVELLAEFGISEVSSRTTLTRLTRRGFLTMSKQGRKTYYGLHPLALEPTREALRRILDFGRGHAGAWDGAWTMVAFSVPESQRQLRHMIRARLRFLGFAALYDGLWCSPWDDREAVCTALSDIGIGSATVLRCEADPRSPLQPIAAWDLDAVRAAYQEFEETFTPVLEDARRGNLTASQGLIRRTQVMDRWRNFVRAEPNLPNDLLPTEWPRDRLRALFIELWDDLAPVAGARCQQIVARHSPQLAALIRPHTTADHSPRTGSA